MSAAKETPRPLWQVETERDGDGDNVYITSGTQSDNYAVALVYGHGGDLETDTQRNETAAFIVEACNAYDTLRRERDEAVALLRALTTLDRFTEKTFGETTDSLFARASAFLFRIDTPKDGKR
jgi:hypothetical protein